MFVLLDMILIPVLKELVNRHIEDKVPIIIEGDFIYPEFTKSFENPEVKSIFVTETDINQILQNYVSREVAIYNITETK